METLYFNKEELLNINTSLRSEIENLDLLFGKIKDDINQINTEWEGKAGDATSSKIKELLSFIDILSSNGTAYTTFLNGAIQRYEEADTI
jgi:uncharacterized protein YukE